MDSSGIYITTCAGDHVPGTARQFDYYLKVTDVTSNGAKYVRFGGCGGGGGREREHRQIHNTYK